MADKANFEMPLGMRMLLKSFGLDETQLKKSVDAFQNIGKTAFDEFRGRMDKIDLDLALIKKALSIPEEGNVITLEHKKDGTNA